MAIDPSIVLSGKPVDTASGINTLADSQQRNNLQQYMVDRQNTQDAESAKTDALKNQLYTQQILKAHYDNMDSREKSRLTSTIAGAAQLQPYLAAGNIEGAKNFLEQRKAMIMQRMGGGENVDTQETDHALQLLNSGDPAKLQELQQGVQGLLAAGSVYGIIKPQSGNGFNLSPGQSHYDESGKLVTTAPVNAGMTLNAPTDGQASGQPNATAQQPVTGDAFLKTLDPNIAAQVKALAEGRQQFPAGFALKSPYWQSMISAVSQYDPSFDAVNYNSRSKTRNDFTSGKSAQNITALNTAMAHLLSLKNSYDALDNGPFPRVNAVANYLGNELGSSKTQTNTTDVSANSTAVSHELAKVFRSSGMSESDIRDWQKQITTSASPAQSAAVISSAIDLMNGRLQAIGQQYNQGMGTTKNPLELLSPDARKAYLKLTGGAKPPANTVTATESNNQQPSVNQPPPGAVFKGTSGGKRVYQRPDGTTIMEQ